MAKGRKEILKTAIIILCIVGFVWQTLQFIFMYWTYPTVVDIQVSVEPEINVPGITVCNDNGFKPGSICKLGPFCSLKAMLKFLPACRIMPVTCKNGRPMEDFRAVAYNRFFWEFHLNTSLFERIKVPLHEFFKCKIVSQSGERKCDTEHAIVSSFYSTENSPSVCYTINSLWSQPHLAIQKIKRSEKIVLEFFVDISFRDSVADLDMKRYPAYNTFSSSTVTMSIHSPYHSASPYVAGVGFLGGRNYKIKIKESEKHLLPPPYQTNCTEYREQWKARGGRGPLNQIMVFQECKLNETLRQLGCVPFSVDYLHDEIICKSCETCENYTKIGDNCTKLLQLYNQPCHSIVYEMQVEEKLVYVEKFLSSASRKWNETMYFGKYGFDCHIFGNKLTQRCQTVKVDILFDEFEIRNITYKPKFESLEVFSAIGGYMGIYLGASIATFYDFVEIGVAAILKYAKKRKETQKKKSQKKKAWIRDDTFLEHSSLRRQRRRKNNVSGRIRNIY